MKNRSLFGPILLIAIGVLWLLVSLHVVPTSNLWALVKFAPYALMGFGLALLVRSRWNLAGQLISGLVVLAAIAAVFFAPQLGWNRADLWSFERGFSGGVQGSGSIKSEVRSVGDFNAIAIHYPGEVVIRQGDTPSVKIEAEDNLLPQLTTDVSGGTLEFDSRQEDWAARVNPTRPVKITITVKDLQKIDFTSAGKLEVESLEAKTLEVILSGAGDIALNNLKLGTLTGTLSGAGNIHADGSADQVELRISGFGSFEGGDLAATNAEVHISGAGDATVRVKTALTAGITGAGSVHYYGSPTIKKEISGAGSVSPAE
jgi:hypothetical protein